MASTRRSGLLALLIVLAGCAPAATTAPNDRGDFRLITEEQIYAATGSNALDIIRALRPTWLQKRGTLSIRGTADIVVYYDHVRFGGPQSLHSIPRANIVRMEFLDAPTATQRWGTGHPHGAIVIVTGT